METSYSGAIHDGFHAQNDRRVLGPIESSISAANHAVLHSQNHR